MEITQIVQSIFITFLKSINNVSAMQSKQEVIQQILDIKTAMYL